MIYKSSLITHFLAWFYYYFELYSNMWNNLPFKKGLSAEKLQGLAHFLYWVTVHLDHFRICFSLSCEQILGFQKLPPLEFIEHCEMEKEMSINIIQVKVSNGYLIGVFLVLTS